MNVRLDQVVKRFGNQAVVDHVSLEIRDGEIFFLLGPSGCGKTTLLRCVAGLCQPDGGRIVIGDRDVTNLPAHQRDTAMVFQSYALWPHMTVRENVAFGLEQRGLSTTDLGQKVDAALAMVRMTDRAGSKPGQLSGGQQQRVALARALVMHPACLLLDEPLSNLDANLRLEMRAEIRRICKESGLTAIYVTHDQKEALSVADRMAVMRDGRVEQVGAPRDVYLRPANRFVAQFIGETNFLDGTIVSTDSNLAIVRTALGPVTCVGAPNVRAGQTVTLSLRPEVIHLDNPPPSHPNVFTGMVHDTVYLGEMAQHQVNIGSNGLPPFKAVELNPRHMARDNALPVACWFEPGDIVMLDH
jgi:iron(III) transport system ATP-binding protein